MSTELVTIILFGGMLLFLALGARVFIGLGFIAILVTLILNGPEGLTMIAFTTYRQVTNTALIAIPLFLLMGNFLVHSGIADRLFTALSYWLSGVRGSLAVVSLAVCVVLAMCSGFTPGIITMGLVAVPAMLKRGYHKSLVLGSVMAGGILGDIIPPSLMMIIYGVITRISIGKLFMGGMIPGFICAAIYTIYILTRSYFQPQIAPKLTEEVHWNMRWVSLREVIIPALLVLAVLGSIFTGAATPSEAASVGAFGALLSIFIYRKFSWKMLKATCLDTLKISGMALWILVAATLFGNVYASAGAQDMIMGIVSSLEVNRWFILIAMQIILLILGMFMDDFAIITITAPIFTPIAVSLGFDPVWFGIIFILNMQIAYMSPPFGWCLILMKGIAPPDVSTRDIWKSVPPFVGMQLLVLILTMVFPMLATWLPSKTA
jgi:tripartite ATP-independent transporter DctM subunit